MFATPSVCCWKHRFATFVCAGALGLGIGANTAIFSMAEGFLLHPVPLEDVNRVVAMVDSQPQRVEIIPSRPQLIWNGNHRLNPLSRCGAYAWDGDNFTGDTTPQKIQDFLVAANFFSVLGVQPQLGRAFLPEEGQPEEIRN